ncbi:MAG: FAD-binding oxidoreductase [Thermoplasmata archaeon]
MDAPVDDLARAVRGPVRSDATTLERFGRDASHVRGRPMAVVAPRDTDDVVALVRWARNTRIPLVARGAGTSLDGESVPLRGGVVVDFSGWNSVLEIRADDGWARVGPGTVNRDLQRALSPHGCFFPPNPGSWTVSTVGGHLGTNASGPRSFRYGPTRAWVRSVDAVLGTGAVVRWGTLAAKRSVGPDLLSLFVGSEGTLAIATEVTVRLAPRPSIRRGIVVPLPGGASLGRVASLLAGGAGTGLSAVEYLDRECAAELSGPGGIDRPGSSALLLLEVEADEAAEGRARLDRVRALLLRAGVPAEPTIFDDSDELWTVRGRAGLALDERLGPRIREDVAVPLGEVDRLVVELERIGEREHVPLYLFGHLGQGSLHPNYAVDPESERADRVRAAVLSAALALHGTISGEHGIGSLKSRFVEQEIGREGVRILRALKQACDPDGILNPGKLYPPPVAPAAGGSSPSPSGSGVEGAPYA